MAPEGPAPRKGRRAATPQPTPDPGDVADRVAGSARAGRATPSERHEQARTEHIADLIAERERLRRDLDGQRIELQGRIDALQGELGPLRERLGRLEGFLAPHLQSVVMVGVGGVVAGTAGMISNEAAKWIVTSAGLATFGWGMCLQIAVTRRVVALRRTP